MPLYLTYFDICMCVFMNKWKNEYMYIRFTAHRQPLWWNFLYHSRIILSVGDSVWYLVRNLRCTVTIDSILMNSKKHNSLLSPVLVMFCHDSPLEVKRASAPWRLLPKQNWRDCLPIDMLISAVCAWLLWCRARNFQKDFWITLCICMCGRFIPLSTKITIKHFIFYHSTLNRFEIFTHCLRIPHIW
jgi:hypothetical protein